MYSDTFTCPECGRTLPRDELAETSDSGTICRDCQNSSESSEDPAMTGGSDSAATGGDDEATISEPNGETPSNSASPTAERPEVPPDREADAQTGTEGSTPPDETAPPTNGEPTESSRVDSPEEMDGPFWTTDPDADLRSIDSEGHTGAPSAPSDIAGDSLDARIDSWKEQLLDLTRRNTLIDFTETKTKSLPLSGATPPRVTGYLRDGDIKIRKQPTDDHSPDAALQPAEVQATRPPGQTADSLYRIGLNEKQFLRERGVDTLYLVLGMIDWTMPEEPDETFRSPLFLTPVDLEQTPVSGGGLHNYRIHPEGDDLLVNPALRKKLTSELNLDLPPDDALGLECIDAAFQAVHEDIDGFDDWQLSPNVILGVFDFAKYSIYTDLEQNRAAIRDNALVRALNDEPDALIEAESELETVSADELDDIIDSRDVYQVLDADSSQQVAIEAAKRGRSFVIQGPPGTGKSQTIANIIAEKLAADETVLFVSEKQAALNVVKDRLDDVGVGRFCLEAHGRKATKSNVLGSLERELQSNPVKTVPDRDEKLSRLEGRRGTLNEYGDGLLDPPDGFTIAPYEAFGKVAVTRDAPTIDIDIETPLTLDQAALDAARDGLEELAYFDTELESYDSHPWRHTTVTQWRIDTGSRVEDIVSQHATAVEAVREVAETLEGALGITVESCARMDDAIALLDHLALRPDIDWQERHFAPEIRELNERLEAFAEHMERIETLRADLLENYQESFLGADGQRLHTAVSGYGVFRFVRPGYYSVKNQIESHTAPTYDPTFHELTEDTRKLMELQQRQADVASFADVEDALGPLFKGAATDWDRLLETQAWVARLHEFPFDPAPIREALLTDSLPPLDPLQDDARDVVEAFDATDDAFREIMAVDDLTADGEHLYEASFTATHDYLTSLADQVDALEGWVEFTQHLEALQETIAADYITHFLEGDHDAADLVPAFEKRFFTKWLNDLYDTSILGEFNADTFRKYLADFRRLDQEQQELAKVAVQHLVTTRRPRLDLEHADSSEQVILRREIQKQRQHKPLRELFDEAGEFVTQLKPCFMMSPLSVAQYLKKDAIEFDTVIFDEASQVMPEDAVSSIIRADQAIIAGDTKQLPPTQFFDTDVAPADGVREDLDSILEEAAAILPEVSLTWHYRSRSAELIDFSNQLYYNGRLQTFPENDPETTTGVEFEYVEDGVYDRGGSRRNDIEADRVVDLVTHHATTQPEKSLGVVAFSVAQEEAIREALEDRRADDDALDRFIDEDDILGEFFVKNLEMVQGDERDRMIFSVGYGPDQDGEVTMNFGPLNQQGGERRLNVAVTRARERVTVVSSLLPDDIDLARTSSTGVEHFKRYLEYARDEQNVLRAGTASGDPALDSAFEQSVYDALTARGYDVDVVASSGYSVDLAVRADADADRYRLGIEFDGSAYRWSSTARDRDRIRPSVLEGLGWDVYRLWAPDWVTNRERVLAELEENLEESLLDDESASSEREEIEVATYEPEEYSRAELDAIQQEVTEYRDPEPNTTYGDSVEAASRDTLERAVQSLVLEHGPIHRDEAFRVLAAEFGEPRRTPTVDETLETHLRSLKLDGRLQVVDEFLWPQKQDLSFVVRQNDGASRSIDKVPLEEIELAITLILDAGFSMTREDLVVETARLFGYERVGTRIDDRVSSAIHRLQQRGFVTDETKLSLSADQRTVKAAILDSIF